MVVCGWVSEQTTKHDILIILFLIIAFYKTAVVSLILCAFLTDGSLQTVSSKPRDEELGEDRGRKEEKEDASGNGGHTWRWVII